MFLKLDIATTQTKYKAVIAFFAAVSKQRLDTPVMAPIRGQGVVSVSTPVYWHAKVVIYILLRKSTARPLSAAPISGNKKRLGVQIRRNKKMANPKSEKNSNGDVRGRAFSVFEVIGANSSVSKISRIARVISRTHVGNGVGLQGVGYV